MNISKIIAAGALATSLAVAQEDAWPADEQTDASTSSATEAEEAEPAEEAAEQSNEAAEPQSETTAQTASEPAPAASEQADTRTAYDSSDNAYAENTASAPQKTNTLNSKMGVGAHIDFNYSFLNGLAQDWNMGDETDAPAGFGFDAGIRGRIPMVDYLQFVPELNFHFAALTQSDEAAERVFKQMDLEIPLTMRATVLDMLYIAAGVQLTLNLSSKVTFEEEDIDMGGGLGTTSMEFNEKIEQAGFTFGLLFGAGFFIMERLSIDAAFMLGLSDMYPDCESDLIESMDGGKQMTFKVGVGYWFM
ncbi:Outer membrane protein beta-barrel domain-containing protein [Fibrobacter sp. UWR3]|uniref:porin family protein n=1 Tax=Fibrobacter sp. UWR3 TaxID=1896217 RepID=UPI00091583F8|nr:porin family protein [Fibrobacter sp. UWR3]SHN05632.1 Outer membrane protein beta-barrel domain-containing protein [Fibrobacter sp. UWR3]